LIIAHFWQNAPAREWQKPLSVAARRWAAAITGSF